MPSHAYLYFCATTAAMGTYHFGFHLSELNTIDKILSCDPGATPSPFESQAASRLPLVRRLPPCIPMSVLQFSIVNALVGFAAIFGAAWAGSAIDRYGRKRTMQLLTLAFVASPLLLGPAVNFAMLIAGRTIAGLGAGAALVVVPIYMSEISPSSKRAITGNIGPLGISIGIAAAGSLGFIWSPAPLWRLMLGSSIITAILQLVLLSFVAESPVYLASQGKDDEAMRVAKSMNAADDWAAQVAAAQAEREEAAMDPMGGGNMRRTDRRNKRSTIASIQGVTPAAPANMAPTMREFLTKPEYRRSMLVLVALHATQQLSGINALFASAFRIMTIVLKSEETANLFNLLFAFYNVLISPIAGPLLERYGRRPLLVISAATMSFFILTVFLFSDSAFDVPILALVGFVLAVTCFGFGLAPVPFIMTAEVVEPVAVGVASRLAMVVNTSAGFIILLVVPPLLELVQSWVFVVFSLFLLVMSYVLYNMVPESKGKTPHQVVAELRQRDARIAGVVRNRKGQRSMVFENRRQKDYDSAW